MEEKNKLQLIGEIAQADNKNLELIEEINEKEEEIERLKEENMQFKTTINSNINSYNKLTEYSNNLEDRVKSLEKINTTMAMEIERLNKGCEELEKQVDDLYELETTLTSEIERLNNIINELEKYLNNSDFRCPDDLYVSACDDTLDKLQELKGESNEKD